MKTFSLSILLTLLTTSTILGQQIPSTTRALPSGATARAASESSPDLKRFDLDFPGGPPQKLVEFITKALGAPLNVIIPNEQKDAEIMPIKVFQVTVPELFSAIESASASERPVVTNIQGGNKSVQFKNVTMGFRANTIPATDQTVWSFYSTAPTADYLAEISGDGQKDSVCQYFQLAPYLDDHSIEDITTAIETGWKMLKVEPLPQLSFHEETKLLIAVGPSAHISQIPQVLQQLQRDDTAAVEKVVKLQAELAEVEAKKEAGWEQKSEEIKARIRGIAAVQRAREEIKAPKPIFPPPARR